jgi:GAF domain-containing protein
MPDTVRQTSTVSHAMLTTPREDLTDGQALARRVCQACVDTLDVDGAAISLATASSTRETLWASDPTAELLEDLQFSLGEGVCVQAARSGVPVLVPDLHHSAQVRRWPVFAAELAQRAHVGALFAVPLQWDAINVGVLDLYRRTPGPLTNSQLSDVLTATSMTARLLLGVLTNPNARDTLEELPSTGRSEIHLAIGMLMVQLQTSAADALARLRAHAFTHHRLLAEVAHDVFTGQLHLEES